MPRSSDIDDERVIAMLELGCPARIIAERLNCTARHVRRIRQRRNVTHRPDSQFGSWWGTEWERHMIWGTLADLYSSTSRVAYLVGRSRQAVAQWVNDDRREDPAEKSADPANWQ